MAGKSRTETRRTNLNDRILKTLKPAPDGKPYDIRDTVVPGLRVRVMGSGQRTFPLLGRSPGSPPPPRRAMAASGEWTLAKARSKAQDWLTLVGKGIDPAIEEERQRAAEQRKQENTFAAVAEDFIKAKLAGERKGEEVERDIRRVFIPAWGRRPITDITALEVRNLIKGFVDAGKPYQAHNLLGYARRLWNWAIGQHAYGIETSPCDRLKPKDIIGKKRARSRVLSDAELRAAWRGGEALGYPYGPLFRLLILTGQRKSEVAEALWSEFDLAKRLWVIPAERMKADAAHVVPLSDDAVALLKALPTFNSGDYLFSTTFGKSPVNGFSKGKIRLDEKMLEILHENDRKAKLPDFVIHDIRRTVRTGLSSIPGISDLVRELVIGHTKPGLHKVYDLHAFIDEKRHALDAWAARLRGIVDPSTSNISPLRRPA